MPGKFWVCRDDDTTDDTAEFRWTFIAPNGRTVVDSAEGFDSEEAAVANLSVFRARAAKALVVEPGGQRVPFAFMLHTCSRGYCWEVTGASGRTLAWSFLPYDTLKAAFKGIAIVRRRVGDAYLVRPGDARQPTTTPRAVRARPDATAQLIDPGRVQQWVQRANAEVLAGR